MSWTEAVVAIVDYVMEGNKKASKARDLADQLAKLRKEIVSAIKAAFNEQTLEDAANEIEQAQDKLRAAQIDEQSLREAETLCNSACSKLNDPDVSIVGHPLYAAAVTLRITILEILKNKKDAERVASEASQHFLNILPSAEAAVGARFKVVQVPTFGHGSPKWAYMLDGREKYRGPKAVAEARMKAARRELIRSQLVPLRRAISLWSAYVKGYVLGRSVALRAANGFYISLTDKDQLIANEDLLTDPWIRWQFVQKNQAVAVLSQNGAYVTVNAPDFVTATVMQLGPNTEFELVQSTSYGVGLKSQIEKKRFLNIQKTQSATETFVHCVDTAQTPEATFTKVEV